MSELRLLHAARIHLDSPLRGLDGQEGDKAPSYRWRRVADLWTTHASGPLEWMDSRTGGSSVIVAARCDAGWRASYKPDARPRVSAWGKSRNAAAQAVQRAVRQR